jgi:prevent-host-death family protein
MKTNRKSRRSPSSRRHRKWQVQEAKAKFSQLIKEASSSGYQTITKNGEPVAYIVSKEEFDQYIKPKKNLLDVFDECPYPDVDIEIERSKDTIRDIDL